MSVLLQPVDGLCTLDGGVPLMTALQAAHAAGSHLGTLSPRFPTLQAALDAGDPLWCSRMVRVQVQTAHGWLAGPLAPRAAMGPDLACFAVGTGARVQAVTVRLDPAVAWVSQSFDGVERALDAVRTLVTRGCSLVELRGLRASPTLTAALPRQGAGRGFTLVEHATLRPLDVRHTLVAAYEDVASMWPAHGEHHLAALDLHRVVLSSSQEERPFPTTSPTPPYLRDVFAPAPEDSRA